VAGPYYVDGAVGNDGNDGLDEGAGHAWATIDKAMNTVAAGETVYVKASATYNENPSIDTAGTLIAPVTFEGYTSTPGDGGRAAITGEIQNTVGARLYYIFKNFDVSNEGGAGAGRCVTLTQSNTTWKNCVFHDNTALSLVSVTVSCFFENCEFNDGVGDGCICITAVFVGCKFYRNSLSGIDGSSFVACIYCEFFSNGSAAIDGASTNDVPLIVVDCTIDGDNDTTTGILKNTANHGGVVVVNNIVYDCVTGMTWGGHADYPGFGISRNNLVNSNTDDYSDGAYTSEGEVTGAPQFADEDNNDYALASGSPARGVGFDLEGNTDIGARQSAGTGTVPPLYPWHVGGA